MILAFVTRTSIRTMTRTPRATRPRRTAALVTAFLVALAGVSSTAAPAVAAPGDPVGVTFGQPEDTVYYGNNWYLEATLKNHECRQRDCDGETLQVTITGPNGVGRTEGFYVDQDGTSYISSQTFGSNLSAGTYSLSAKYISPYTTRSHPGMSRNNKPGTLVIKAAPLSIDLRVETDENQPAGAVVSSQLLGDFVEKPNDCWEGSSCKRILADGTWDFEITDAAGETIIEKSIETKADASRFASFYWHDVPPSSDYSATATFTPVKSGVGNFTFDAPGTAAFTSPDAPSTGLPGTPEEPVVAEPSTAGSSIPLWSVLAWFAALLVLFAIAIVFATLVVRQRRTSARLTTTTEGALA